MDERFRGAVRRAVALRHRLFGPPNEWRDTNAVRLVFSEADGLSGLVADQYAGVVALQVGSKVWEPWLPAVIDELKREAGADAVTVRADSDAIQREGLTNDLGGDPAPERVVIQENGYSFEVGLTGGQKTGFYLISATTGARWPPMPGDDVLSAYCYTGAFEVCAAHAGATKITGWDSSEAALVQARRHHELNPSGVPAVYEVADVPRRLRLARDRREAWDLIILDPPRMVTRRDGLEGIARLQDVNLLAIKLRPGDPHVFVLGPRT